MPHFHYPEIREAANQLRQLGFEYVGNSGHPQFEHSDHGKISLALTPSDRKRWSQNFRSNLAKQIGISKHQLEMRLGIRQEKRQGPRVRRQRNEEGRRRRTFGNKPPPSAVASLPRPKTGPERFEELPDLIAKANHAVNTALPGSLAYKRALSEVAQLRAEYMQLEADVA